MLPLEHHFLRAASGTPLRFFPEFTDMDNNNLMSSIEKARILHQQWLMRGGPPPGFPGENSSGQRPPPPGSGGSPSIHQFLAAASASGMPPMPQLYTLNTTRGSPSPLPIPAQLWSQWSALSQLPPGFLGQSQQFQQQIAQQMQQQASNSPPGSNNVTRGLRYSPYPPQPPIPGTKGSSTSPNVGAMPPIINEPMNCNNRS